METDKLTVESIRGYELDVELSSGHVCVPCVSLDLVMSLNSMHKCSLFIAIGRSISDPESVENGTDIYTVLFNNMTIPPCAVREYVGVNNPEENADKSAGRVVFKGYVMAAALDYKASKTASSIRVRVDCLGPACKLTLHPNNLYTETSTGVLIQKLNHTRSDSQQTKGGSDTSTGGAYTRDRQLIMRKALPTMVRMPAIKDKIAYAVSLVRLACSACIIKDTDIESITADADVENALGGSLKLNSALASVRGDLESGGLWIGKCEEKLSETLLKNICAGMSQDSIFNTILRVLSSFEFGLQLAPRFNCEGGENSEDYDFKIEICKAISIHNSPVGTLYSKHIKGISSSFETLSWLDTPDVVLASFEGASSYFRGISGISNGLFGAASYIKELNDTLWNATEQHNYGLLLDLVAEKKLKVRQVRAPSWLVFLIVGNENRLVDNSYKDDTKGRNNPVQLKEESSAEDTPLKPVESNGSDPLAAAANNAAYNLLTLLYRNESNVTIELMPNYRFGLGSVFLENNIGQRIAVDLSEDANFGGVLTEKERKQFYFEGTLDTIRYSWATSPAAFIKYTITLKNVQFGENARDHRADDYASLYTT